MTRIRDVTGEEGSAIVEMTWLGLILLIPLVYIVVAVYEVQSAAYGVSAAGRAAGRAYVQAPDPATGQRRAERAAALVLEDHDVTTGQSALDIGCRDGACLSPGSSVVVSVRAHVPLPFVPDVLGSARPTVRIKSTHTEPYGRFREDRS